MLWEWANDPSVRQVSFFPDSISWEEHQKWFAAKLKSSNCHIYLAINEEGMPIGVVRYDGEDEEALISVSIQAKFRGKGYGKKLIRIGCQKIFEITKVTSINAYVKLENVVSIKVFEKAGFKKVGRTLIHDHEAIHLILSKAPQDE